MLGQTKPAKTARLNARGPSDLSSKCWQCFFAGPFMSEKDDKSDAPPTPIGSMLVIEAEDRQAAENLAAADPYAIAGLFDSVEIHPWNHSFGSLPKA